MSDGSRIHFRTCSLCEAMCGLRMEVHGEKIVDVRGDALDPLSEGHICPKAWALVDVQEDPDRLRRPLRRRGRDFEEVSWDEALDEAASRLHEVGERHGRGSRAVYLGNPTIHNLGGMIFGPPFIRALRTKNRFSATSVDQLPHMLAAYLMWGHQLLLPVPDLDRTDFLVVMGGNPAVSAGSLMGAPGFRRRVTALKARGGRMWVFDPRRTETATLADAHHFVRPGTDAWLLLRVLARLLERGAQPCDMGMPLLGQDALEGALAEIGQFDVEAKCGVPESVAKALADGLLDTPRAVLYGRMGLSTQPFGGLCQWLINLIHLYAGKLDRVGGALLSAPAVESRNAPKGLGVGKGSFGRFRSRVRRLPEFGGELPVACLSEEILEPGKGQIRALVTYAGNPVLSTPNGPRLGEAMGSLEFMLSVDPYLNETTRHAHLILPPAGPLERSHYDLALGLLTIRDTAKFSPACLPLSHGARHDWQILSGLTRRLLRLDKAPLGQRATAATLSMLGPERLVDLGLRAGPYGARPWRRNRGLTLAKLRASPHGLDLGPRPERTLASRLPDGASLDLAPPDLVADLDRLRAESAGDHKELALVGRRQLRSNNSWLHNSERLMRGKDRCTLLMHPEDAARAGVAQGDVVEIESVAGRVVAPVSVSEEMMPGVVSLPHGFGHEGEGIRLRVASRQPGVNVNALNSELRLDELSGNAAFSGQPVQVRPRRP